MITNDKNLAEVPLSFLESHVIALEWSHQKIEEALCELDWSDMPIDEQTILSRLLEETKLTCDLYRSLYKQRKNEV